MENPLLKSRFPATDKTQALSAIYWEKRAFGCGNRVLSERKVSIKTSSQFLDTSKLKTQQNLDRGFRWLTWFCATLIPLTLMSILVTLFVGALPAIEKFGGKFLFTEAWDPVQEQFGGIVAIYGTLVTSFIALVIAVPTSFGIALFLSELSPQWLRKPLSTAIELLAAIPSIIYGMWGLFVFAPVLAEYVQPSIMAAFGEVPFLGVFFEGAPMGIGIFTAGIILAIMIIPFIASVMSDVFSTVPKVLKESAYGIGATTWEVAWKITLPYTRVGVIGGIMLGLGRALGETMAITFVIGNAHRLTPSLFMPGSTISSVLANEFTEAVGPLYTSALILLGLVLFLITFVVIAISKVLLMRLQRLEGANS